MKRIWLFGTSYMGREYYKVLRDLDVDVTVIGRGEKNVEEFRNEFPEVRIFSGQMADTLAKLKEVADMAIIAVDIKALSEVTKMVLNKGVKKILLEKPGAMSGQELQEMQEMAKHLHREIYIGYNRRFYASVEAAQKIIEEDGGVSSFHFEFTEWAHTIANWSKPDYCKQTVLHCNSTHVIDLAFYLGGEPKEMSCFYQGGTYWHKNATQFSGAGISEKGALFSYCANWEAPGRWAVEIMTKKHRLYFKPMEKLQIQNQASVKVEPYEINEELDLKYKPGLYRMLEEFFKDEPDDRLLTLAKHIEYWELYNRIAGGEEV